MSWPWSELGLEGPSGSGEVKRAYAQRVKTVHPEEDPEGFQQLYAAYQTARRIARAAEQDARLLMEEAASFIFHIPSNLQLQEPLHIAVITSHADHATSPTAAFL